VTATVSLVGASHPAARALALALEADPAVERVIGLDANEPPVLGPKFEFVRAREGERLAAQLGGSDVVALFPTLDAAARDGDRQGRTVLDIAEHVRKGAEAAGARRLVLWSSGVVYGAHADNPVPLAESDPIRPEPGFPIAGQLAEIERVVLGFDGQDGAVVLRAAPVWAPTWGTVFSRWLAAPVLLGISGANPVMQALHPDDAAGGLAHAVTAAVPSGTYNLAPEDWVEAGEVAAIAGRRRVQLPEPLMVTLAERLWALGVADGPPGELQYLMWPWVLDAAKLRATGWSPVKTTRAALGEAGGAQRDGVALGRLTIRREDIYRGIGAGLAGVTLLALARRAASRR
jgi:nucleoside-diphosphate-sugar epimerase